MKVPLSTSSWHSRSYSSAEPSHHSTRSGVVRAATSSTQSISLLLCGGGHRSGRFLLGVPAVTGADGRRRRCVGTRLNGRHGAVARSQTQATPDVVDAAGRRGCRPEAGSPSSLARATASGPPPAGELWIGDDAAVVAAAPAGRLVLATDAVVAGVHADLAAGRPGRPRAGRR